MLRPHHELIESMKDDPLLTPAEISRIFRVNPRTVNRWAKAGRLTAVLTPGGHRRYRASEITRALQPEVLD